MGRVLLFFREDTSRRLVISLSRSVASSEYYTPRYKDDRDHLSSV